MNLDENIAALSSARFKKINRDPTRCPRVMFLIGAPASGKSTWTANYLAQATRPTIVLSTDDLIEDYALEHNISYSEAFDQLDMKTLENTMRDRMISAIRNNQDVIVDRTNMRVRSRNRWLSQVPSHYVRVGIRFEVDSDTLHNRLRHRAATTGKFVPHHIVDDMLSSHQPPTFDEFDIIEAI